MRKWTVAASLAALLAGGASALAADLPTAKAPPPPPPPPPNSWQFTIALPAWGTWVNSSVGVRNLPAARSVMGLGTLLADLKGIFATTLTAHNDTFIVGLDFLWSRIGDGVSFESTGVGPYANVNKSTTANLTEDLTLATAFGGYRLPFGGPDLHLYGTLGARYTGIAATVNLTQQFGTVLALQPVGFSLSTRQSTSWVDPVVGLAGRYAFNEKWYLEGYADIGGFGIASKITTLDTLSVGYNWTPHIATTLGFKVLYDDYEKGTSTGSFRYKSTMYGPLATIAYTF